MRGYETFGLSSSPLRGVSAVRVYIFLMCLSSMSICSLLALAGIWISERGAGGYLICFYGFLWVFVWGFQKK